MKAIIKGNEPISLTEHRAKQHASCDNLDKTDVRASLLTEQGHICCYCMKRIPESNTNPSLKAVSIPPLASLGLIIFQSTYC